MKTTSLFAAAAAVALCLPMLGACGSNDTVAPEPSATTASHEPTAFDQGAYLDLLSTGPIASNVTLDGSEWAQAVRQAGVLRVAGPGFAGEGARSAEQAQGDFDAGLAELLARFVLGENGSVEWVSAGEDCESALAAPRAAQSASHGRKGAGASADPAAEAEASTGADVAIDACEWTATRTRGADYAGPYYAPDDETRYGIALPRGDGRKIVTAFLEAIEYDGSYEELWQLAVAPVLGGEMPDVPRLKR